MVDIKKSLAGTATFFAGYALVLLTQHIMPPLIAYLNDTLAGIMWLGLIIIWILGLCIIPIGMLVWSITTPSEQQNPMFGIITGILYFIFASAFTYFTYYWTTPMLNVITYPIITVLFWLGIISIWIFNIAIIPAYYIIEAKGN